MPASSSEAPLTTGVKGSSNISDLRMIEASLTKICGNDWLFATL
ncbi:MAG: hypothetical protein BWZ10_02210 [candidate division BRC1 bacterium ADurb.BinA364]|nr:MAG: hypothetical protein BWZ10_02210 [candidate division BRC1 bacterium ADurb.BinA364]